MGDDSIAGKAGITWADYLSKIIIKKSDGRYQKFRLEGGLIVVDQISESRESSEGNCWHTVIEDGDECTLMFAEHQDDGRRRRRLIKRLNRLQESSGHQW